MHEAVALGATQIMLQGGLNPALDLSWYETMLRAIKADHPTIWLHSLSPAEVRWLGQGSGLSIGDTLLRLRQAGLDSLPGGGRGDIGGGRSSTHQPGQTDSGPVV